MVQKDGDNTLTTQVGIFFRPGKKQPAHFQDREGEGNRVLVSINLSINLSKHNMSEEEIWILQKDLSFFT